MTVIDEKLKERFGRQHDGYLEEDEELRLRFIAQSYAACENSVAVLSNHRTDKSHIYFGRTSDILGLGPSGTNMTIDSIWEEEILNRVHTDDMRHRNLREMAFSHFVLSQHSADAFAWRMENTMRMCDRRGDYVPVMHRITYFPGKGQRGINYALCLYNIAAKMNKTAVLKNSLTGEQRQLDVDERRLLTDRETTILALVREGLSSKMIGERLKISKNTVDRHRQNIIIKMQSANMAEACHKAKILGLIEQE